MGLVGVQFYRLGLGKIFFIRGVEPVLDRSRDLAGAETEAGATILTGAETGAGPEPE